MWSVGSEPFDLYIGSDRAALYRRGGCLGVGSHESVQAAVRRWFRAAVDARSRRWRPAGVRVWLSGRLARAVTFDPPQGLRRWSEVVQLATVAAGGHAEPPQGSSLRVLVEAWRGDGSALAVACDESLLTALNGAAREVGVRLSSIRPWWAGTLDQGRLPGIERIRLLSAKDSDVLTVLTSDRGGAWSAADIYDPAPEASNNEQLLARRLVAADLTEADLCHVEIDLSAPGGSPSLWPLQVGRSKS